MSFLPYRLRQVQIDRLSQDELESVISRLSNLLDSCERLVAETVMANAKVRYPGILPTCLDSSLANGRIFRDSKHQMTLPT